MHINCIVEKGCERAKLIIIKGIRGDVKRIILKKIEEFEKIEEDAS